jgi:anti-sigma factor ChrR (cupin superfamily)
VTAKRPTDNLRERAALYALGALTPDEARAFELELRGDAECQNELAAFRAVADDLAHAAAPQVPPPALRDRVLARIAADETAVLDQGGIRFVRSDRLGWQAGPLPGLEVKRLSIDAERGRRTTLVRMAPGAVYPAHRHRDVEEIYLLEGEVMMSGVLMRAGDYCRAEADTVHADTRTQTGCVFIVTASVHDQRIP